MLPGEFGTENANVQVMLDGSFTNEEMMRLRALRARADAHPDYEDRGIDERRLKFLRWLVEHGKLSDDC
jgi:hypothetical protein